MHSGRRSLILLILAALLPLCLMAAVLGTLWLRDKHAAVERHVRDHVDHVGALVNRELIAQIEILRNLAQSTLLDGSLAGEAAQDAFFQQAERTRRELPLWFRVTLTDPEGVRLASC